MEYCGYSVMNVVFFDRFDPWASYQSCVEYVNDKEYCKKAVALLAEAQVRLQYDYGGKVRLRAVLPHAKHNYAMATDKGRRFIVIFIDGGAYTAVLLYERRGGDFALKTVDWITTELKALKNPHPATAEH